MEMYSFIPKQFIIVCGVKCNNISFSYWCWIETHHSEITFFSAAAGAKRTLFGQLAVCWQEEVLLRTPALSKQKGPKSHGNFPLTATASQQRGLLLSRTNTHTLPPISNHGMRRERVWRNESCAPFFSFSLPCMTGDLVSGRKCQASYEPKRRDALTRMWPLT